MTHWNMLAPALDVSKTTAFLTLFSVFPNCEHTTHVYNITFIFDKYCYRWAVVISLEYEYHPEITMSSTITYKILNTQKLTHGALVNTKQVICYATMQGTIRSLPCFVVGIQYHLTVGILELLSRLHCSANVLDWGTVYQNIISPLEHLYSVREFRCMSVLNAI